MLGVASAPADNHVKQRTPNPLPARDNVKTLSETESTTYISALPAWPLYVTLTLQYLTSSSYLL